MDLKSHWIHAAQSSGVWSVSVSGEWMEQGLGLLSMKSLWLLLATEQALKFQFRGRQI